MKFDSTKADGQFKKTASNAKLCKLCAEKCPTSNVPISSTKNPAFGAQHQP